MDHATLLSRIEESATLEQLIALEDEAASQFSYLDSNYSLATSGALPTASDWKTFCDEVSSFHGELQLILTVCKILADKPEGSASLDVLSNEEKWSAKNKRLQEEYENLKRVAKKNNFPDHVLSEEKRLLREVQQGAKRVLDASLVVNEEESNLQAAKSRFLSRLQRLNDWVEKQVVNLEAMKENEKDLQAFAYRFVEASSSLTEKLCKTFDEVKEFILKDKEMLFSLQQFVELWFYLLDQLLHCLAQAVCEIHDSTPLEEVAGECSMYLKQLPEIFSKHANTSGPHSLQSTAEDAQEFATILETWRDRYTFQQSAMKFFRETALSRLTYIPSDDKYVVDAVQRQQEYEQIVGELRAWAEEESRTVSWRSIYDKITMLQDTVDTMIQASSEEDQA